MERIEVKSENVKFYPRYQITGKTINFKIKSIPNDQDPIVWVKEALNQVVERAVAHLEPSDLVGFTFSSANFSRGQGWMPFKEAEKIRTEDIFNMLDGIYQSNSSGLDTGSFEIGVTSVKLPRGKGKRSSSNYNTFDEECSSRKGIIAIKNVDNLCLPQALVVAISKVSGDPTYNNILNNTNGLQKDKALKLCQDAGVVVPPEGSGIDELQKFQDYLKNDYKIVVYIYGTKGRETFFEGNSSSEQKLNLLYHKNHFNVVISLTAAFSCSYFCSICHVPYNTKDKHRCKKLCYVCKTDGVCPRDLTKQCPDCNRFFYSDECFEKHKAPGSYFSNQRSVCQELKMCLQCRKPFRSGREHYCGEIFCRICFTHQPSDHYCFMQIDKKKPTLENILYIFFDLETRQEKSDDNDSVQHVPNLCVLKTACDECIDCTDIDCCKKCGPNMQIFRSAPVKSLISLILTKRKLFKEVIVLSHYGSGFDMQFVFSTLIKETDLTPDIILTGTKIIMLKVANVKFIDSLKFMPMALADLPKAFGLGDKFKKGYFPHLFNTKEHENYIGSFPDVEFYDPDSMSVEKRKIFMQWYEENKHLEFDFQQELIDYCISDVEILKEACLKFRKLMLETSNVCPFTESCTIPGACNKIFRRNYLREKSIAIIPKNGYRCVNNQSKIATKWLIWEEKSRNIDIKYAAKQKEVEIGGYKVDGFCEETKQIFEFHGCWWHACLSCFPNDREKSLKGDLNSFNLRYESTVFKTEFLKSMGYEVIEKWECEFLNELKQNKEMKNYVDNHALLNFEPLDPRDAFYGGRTENFKLYYKATGDEKIHYLDVCSLYPWVCKFGKFPVGHPQVFVGEMCKTLDLSKTNGLIKCKVLAPQDLYQPVLPKKMNNKLMFVLCEKCGFEMDQSATCSHSEEDRALQGTWVIDEVLKALEKGYKILEIYEIWRYEIEQYDHNSRKGGLFVNMMNKFIKIKQEASGWPGECQTEEDKNVYIEQFFEKEGIQLDREKIEKNPGLRSLAKLILNSFWGKFGQLERKPQTKIVKTYKDFLNIMTSPLIEINSMVPIDDETVIISFVEREEMYERLGTVNVAIAAYVTAQARLKLFSYLDLLQRQVLYCDTDSVIFYHKDGLRFPPIGEFIGDLTNELDCYGNGSFISEFACGGPKNYAFKVYSTNEQEEKCICKVKGIKLNYKASQIINFEVIKNMILNPSESLPVSIVTDNLRRTKTHDVISKEESKQYRIVAVKRKFLENYDSVPYGYKKLKI